MRSSLLCSAYKKSTGFTLIEIIIGIVVLAISLSVVTSLIIPSEENSVDQVHQIKAAELGQSMLNEILAKAFDENSDKAGGRLRCDEDQDKSGDVEIGEKCTTALSKDPGENDRNDFDDVDDYNDYKILKTSTDSALDSGYGSFTIKVDVVREGAGAPFGVHDSLVKLITVTVTTPLGTAIEFAGYKANF
ncbi:MAG: MSHA pilin protein MshD [Alteromonadaceae bacterium]|jgi:MSHA pilin protein MshD